METTEVRESTQNEKRDIRYVSRKETLAYGAANGGMVVNRNIITTYLNYFLINVFRVNSSAVASMFLLEGIWDIVNDPMMGVLVDRTRTRWGKLRPYLLAVPLPMAVITVFLTAGPLLISNPSENALSKIIYMFVTYTLWETFTTLMEVPFWGMSAAISPNPKDRTRVITSARFISTFFGGLPQFIVPLLLDASAKEGGPNIKHVFFGIGLVSGLVGMGFFSLAGIYTKERVPQALEEPTLRECLECMIKNPPLRLLMLRGVINTLGGIRNSFTTYFYVDVLGSASRSIIVGIPSGFTNWFAYLCLPLIRKWHNNNSKHMLYSSQITNAALSTVSYLLGMRNYNKPDFMMVLMMIKQGLAELFNGVNTVIPTEMTGETVDYMEWQTGRRPEGVSFAALSFLGKFGDVLARSLGAFLLKPIGYQTSPTHAAIPQTERTKKGIWFMFMAAPVLFDLLSMIPLRHYDLVGEKRETMLAELAERRALVSREMAEQEPDNAAKAQA